MPFFLTLGAVANPNQAGGYLTYDKYHAIVVAIMNTLVNAEPHSAAEDPRMDPEKLDRLLNHPTARERVTAIGNLAYYAAQAYHQARRGTGYNSPSARSTNLDPGVIAERLIDRQLPFRLTRLNFQLAALGHVDKKKR